MPQTLERTLHIEAPRDDIDTVLDLLSAVWTAVPNLPDADRFRFETALIELAMNVLQYADAGDGVVCDLDIRISDERLDAALTDTGIAAEIDLEHREMPDDMAESGRGLALVKALVDEVGYDREGDRNHWRISKRRCA